MKNKINRDIVINLPELEEQLSMFTTTWIDWRNSHEKYGAACWTAAQKELLDRLNKGVEVPGAFAAIDIDPDPNGVEIGEIVSVYSLDQLTEYGAAQRLAGAKEEREECAKYVESVTIRKRLLAAAIRSRGEA